MKKITKKPLTQSQLRQTMNDLVAQLDELGEQIKEYSYDSYSADEDATFGCTIDTYTDDNSAFCSSCREYVEAYDELCRMYSKLSSSKEA